MRVAMRRAVARAKRQSLASAGGSDDLLADVSACGRRLGPAARNTRGVRRASARLRAVAVLRIYVGLSEKQTAQVLEMLGRHRQITAAFSKDATSNALDR